MLVEVEKQEWKSLTEKSWEESAIILDFLPHGYHTKGKTGKMRTPIAQAMGKDHFVLLELVPKKDARLQVNEEVYIGEGKRDKIHHINGKLPPKKLTSTAKLEIEFTVADMIKKTRKIH